MAGVKVLTLAQASVRVKETPHDAFAWRELGRNLFNEMRLAEAREALEKAIGLKQDDAMAWAVLGHIEVQSDNDAAAQKLFRKALEIDDKTADAHHGMAGVMLRLNNTAGALTHIERAIALGLKTPASLTSHSVILARNFRYREAATILERLLKEDPKNRYSHLVNLGNLRRDLGQFTEAEACYQEAAKLAPQNPIPLANLLSLLHYMPTKSADDILKACKAWGDKLALPKRADRPKPADLSPTRKLRVGMFSDGFRQHPVGAMTTTALEHLVKMGFELYMYTTSPAIDLVTNRLIAIAAKWTPIAKMSEDQFAQRLRDDNIDILIDLAGHSNGTRMQAMTLEPAPLLVKWVGGLINTTGVEAIDYLITDSIESPPGSDEYYTEKLIRMPDDYICYMPPLRIPSVGGLPALRNGYVTFGCFNNPTKINDVLLVEWAKLMQAVPNSRLFLKSGPYDSAELREHILDVLKANGVEAERVRFEGQSHHFELFERYNEVDVALDPWPYSGGLTTCEAMLMGVPVVTLPGPTFAGRHSATHLVNAGMPELVVNSWDEYRARVLDLISDLNSLSTIRQHLRQILLESPVCNGEKFAGHLASALRAIWQRYIAGKTPAALAFTPEGQPWFEDEDAPMQVLHPEPEAPAFTTSDAPDRFNFAFQGKIIALDHGGILVGTPMLHGPSKMGALTTVVIDPASRLRDVEKLKYEKHLHHYHSHIALGDGEPGVLYTCLDTEWSGTLEPLATAKQLPFMRQPASVLAKLPIATTRLDGIDGLDKLDWIILNETNDHKKIIQGAEGLMDSVLIVHARILFVDVYKKQADLSALSKLLGKHGLRLLRLDRNRFANYFSAADKVKPHRGSQLLTADAIFVPDEARMKTLDDNQRLKLAFILHTCYGSPDFTHHILGRIDSDTAQRYLSASGWLAPEKREPAAGAGKVFHALPAPTGKKRYIHLAFNNVNIQPLIRFLAAPVLSEDFDHMILIEKSRSMAGYDNDVSGNPNAFFFSAATDLDKVLRELLHDDVAGIFFHGMFFEWQKQLARIVGPRKKSAWIMWGGDLYNPIKLGKPISDVVEQLTAVCPLTDGDYQFFLQHYPEKPRWNFAYAGMSDLVGIEMPKQKEKQIFVGNSGDPSNCHMEILTALSKKRDIADYRIIMPVSYNLDPSYEIDLVRKVADLGLKDQVTYLKSIIPVREYYGMLAQSEFCITAHHRQQALGNIIASLYFGTKTVLRQNIVFDGKVMLNPAWQRVKDEFSAEPVDFEAFLGYERLSDVPYVAPASLASQQEKILQANDLDSMKQTMKARFLDIAKQ